MYPPRSPEQTYTLGDSMRPLARSLILLVASLLPCSSSATSVDGRWGLGVNVGSLLSSRAEASLLRGVSPGTAWILDLSVSESRDDRDFATRLVEPGVDTTLSGPRTFESFSVYAGPRLRKFMKAEDALSPYGDAFVHFIDRYDRSSGSGFSSPGESSNKNVEAGGEVGLGFGVEYFLTRWPISLAAHSNLLRVRVTKVWSEYTSSNVAQGYLQRVHSSGTFISTSMTLDPALQVRVYF